MRKHRNYLHVSWPSRFIKDKETPIAAAMTQQKWKSKQIQNLTQSRLKPRIGPKPPSGMWYRLGILPSAGKFHDRTVVRYLLGFAYCSVHARQRTHRLTAAGTKTSFEIRDKVLVRVSEDHDPELVDFQPMIQYSQKDHGGCRFEDISIFMSSLCCLYQSLRKFRYGHGIPLWAFNTNILTRIPPKL
jgi:hypothetical protein